MEHNNFPFTPVLPRIESCCVSSHLPDEAVGGEQLGHEGDADELEVSQLLAAVALHAEDQLLHLLLRLLLLLPASLPGDAAT